ncbi:MAG: hypothetical protein H8E44_34350 [Planctomycetes bacterium]|nr:hypothetical protein [Planctomycetota bacterium]
MRSILQTIALAGLVVAASQLGPTGMAIAAQFRSGDKVVVEADEIVEEDLYVCASEVTIDGRIQGDLIVFAGHITVNGLIDGDLIAVGQTVLLTGAVDDDVRMAGQVLKLASRSDVADDVIAAGFSFEAEDDSTVGGEINYAGFQAKLAGSVDKGITASTANCELSGAVGGDVRLGVDPNKDAPSPQAFSSTPRVAIPTVPAGLTVASSAKIDGILAYRSPVEGNIDKDAEIAGGIEYQRHSVSTSSEAELTNREKAIALAREFACVAIIGLCVLLVAPRWSQSLAESIRTRPFASLGGGVLGIVFFVISLIVFLGLIFILGFAFSLATLEELVPVVAMVGALSLVGMVGGFWFFTSYLAQIAVSLALGRFMLFAGKTQHRLVPFLAGLVVVVLLVNLPVLVNLPDLMDVPYVDQIIRGLVIIIGFGGLTLWFIGSRSRAGGGNATGN